MSDKEIDVLFSKVEDEYDLIALTGKIMAEHNISMGAKDAIKTIIRESVNFGYNLGLQDKKK